MTFGIIERLLKKILNTAGIRLIHCIVDAESIVENLQEIRGVKAMSEVRDEVDIGLGGGAEIENGQSGRVADVLEELFEAAAGALGYGRFSRRLLSKQRPEFAAWHAPDCCSARGPRRMLFSLSGSMLGSPLTVYLLLIFRRACRRMRRRSAAAGAGGGGVGGLSRVDRWLCASGLSALASRYRCCL